MINQEVLPFLFISLILIGLSIVVVVYAVLPYLVTRYTIDRRSPARILPPPAARGLVAKAVTFDTADGMTIAGWWFANGSKQSVIIMAHGRGSHKADLLDQAILLFEQGHNVLLIDLRAHGDSKGRWVSAGRHEADDLLAAVAFVRHSKQQSGPIVLYGFSLGARAALFAATHRPDIAGVIAIAPRSLSGKLDQPSIQTTGWFAGSTRFLSLLRHVSPVAEQNFL